MHRCRPQLAETTSWEHGYVTAAACALAFLTSCGGRTSSQEQTNVEVPVAQQPNMPPRQDTPQQGPPAVADPPATPRPTPVPMPTPIEPDPPSVEPPRCAGDVPFGEPSPLPGLDPALSIDGAWLSQDGLELMVGARAADAGARQFDLLVARRRSLNVAFGKLEAIQELNTAAIERKPAVTADGLTLFFESDRGGETSDIYLAERGSRTEKFGAARIVEEVSTTRNDAPGDVSVANTLYLTSVRPGGEGNENIYVATRSNDGSFGELFLISSVDSDGSNIAPRVSSDELTLFFSSTRDNRGEAGHDVYRARRSALGKHFDVPRPVVELNSAGSDLVAWVSLDECSLLLTRETPPGSGHFILFQTER